MWGEIHHIATDQGPMFQGGLLTAHPGGVHGYGWSPGGVPPSGRVPEQLLQEASILKRRRRRYRGEIGKKGFILGVSSARGKYRQGGHQGDPPVSQEAPWRGLGWGRGRDPSGLLVVAPLPSLDFSGSFRSADFLSDFSGIFGALLIAGKPKIQKQ